jgi:hypothetical protein
VRKYLLKTQVEVVYVDANQFGAPHAAVGQHAHDRRVAAIDEPVIERGNVARSSSATIGTGRTVGIGSSRTSAGLCSKPLSASAAM